MRALKELFAEHILKDDVKLVAFQYNPHVTGRPESEVAHFELIDAYCEHCVKEMYREYATEILVGFSKDDLEYFRKAGLDMLVELISSKPEIEEVILGILINKLGDGSKKVQQHAI